MMKDMEHSDTSEGDHRILYEETVKCGCELCRLKKNGFGDTLDYEVIDNTKLSPEQERNKPKHTWQEPRRE